MTRRGRLRIGVVLVPGVVLGVALAASGAAPWVASAQADAGAGSGVCDQVRVDGAFRPSSLTVAGVVGPMRVLALGQDQHGVPRPPPLTERGKWQFAWDKAAGVRPGGSEGVVRLTAHTYPRDGSQGSALGNLLLARLRPGAQLEVSGAGSQRLCYRVARRVQVKAHASLSGYYATTGSPRLAILVCSGIRRGPGDWSHRTIWYAEPTLAAPEQT